MWGEPGRAISLPRSAVRRRQLGSRLWRVPPPHPGSGLQGPHQLFPRATWWGPRVKALRKCAPRPVAPGSSSLRTPRSYDRSPPRPHPGTLPSRGCGPFSSRCLGFGVLNSRLCRFWGGCVTRSSVPQRVGEESWLRLGDGVTAPSALRAGG